jgi:wobble nucleotide-excising tRNase
VINALRLIRNIGQFDSVAEGANLALARLTLLYAENGRGKTTIAAIIRSLATGDPVPIMERRRLAAAHPPNVVVECVGGPPAYAMFQNAAWNRTLSGVLIFDEFFVNSNVYSGLVVEADHRQHLHELILGAAGVRLNAELQGHVSRIEEHNREIRQRANAIPDDICAGMSVDDFCALPQRATIEDEIAVAQQHLEEATHRQPITATQALPIIGAPPIDLPAIANVLESNLPALEAVAAARVEAHIASLGRGGQEWVSQGTRFVRPEPDAPCPFCAQPLGQSPLIGHYRAYFGAEYEGLRRAIANARNQVTQAHSDAAIAQLEARLRTAAERGQFWRQFTEMPQMLDIETLSTQWRAARQAVLGLLDRKLADPLTSMQVDEGARAAVAAHEANREALNTLNQRFAETNRVIEGVKQRAAQADVVQLTRRLALLKAIRMRHIANVSQLCDAYMAAKAAKIVTEQAREGAKAALEQYRREVFPAYQDAINRYLQRFGASFRIGAVEAGDTRGGPTCTYNVVINNVAIAVSGETQPGQPSFGTVLSSGDKSALALAFFFASLEADPALGDRIVVIDDPVSSLDDHRTITTVHEIQDLSRRVSQVIVLSHNKPFLCEVWDGADRLNRAALEVARTGQGSTLRAWNVDAASETEHDRRHAMLRSYRDGNAQDLRQVAVALRPALESFVRVAFPEHFPAGSMLGPFVDTCRQRLNAGQQVLGATLTRELGELVDYANRFHHDTNNAADREVINDQQLLTFVRRTLDFARR